jgi:hypothetical protein
MATTNYKRILELHTQGPNCAHFADYFSFLHSYCYFSQQRHRDMQLVGRYMSVPGVSNEATFEYFGF